VISAKLDKAPEDPSAMPQRIKESGLGDRQIQLDWRMLYETKSRPEVFSYLEVVFPSNKSKPLIGTPDFEYKAGAGITRGMSWGTLTARVAAEYSQADKKGDLGEYALEYLKRLSRSWRVYAGIEGAQDEIELIGEAQWHLSERIYLRMTLGHGLSSKATDWAPDVGIVFAFPLRKAAR
jgi:hypothetical protein